MSKIPYRKIINKKTGKIKSAGFSELECPDGYEVIFEKPKSTDISEKKLSGIDLYDFLIMLFKNEDISKRLEITKRVNHILIVLKNIGLVSLNDYNAIKIELESSTGDILTPTEISYVKDTVDSFVLNFRELI